MSITKSKLKLFGSVLFVVVLWNASYTSAQTAFQNAVDSKSSRIAQLENV